MYNQLFSWLFLGLCLLPLCACDDGGSGTPLGDGDLTDMAGDAGADGGECALGTDGCRCRPNDVCVDDLQCIGGVCQADPCDPAVERCPPANPVCYTPCQGDLVAEDGTLRRCGEDRLMNGCLSDARCERGTCVPLQAQKQAGQPGVCQSDVECPDFQACIRGRCYAECNERDDCLRGDGVERVCARHVCRTTCGEERICPNPGENCQSTTLVPQSVCVKAAPPSARGDRLAIDFAVSPPIIPIGRPTPAILRVTNPGAAPLAITVTPTEHVIINGDGTLAHFAERPLPWLTLEGAGPNGAYIVEANDTLEITLTGDRPEPGRWEGRLRVTASDGTWRDVQLTYDQQVAGRWTGTAFAFGNFQAGDPGELAAWSEDRDADMPVENAFLRAWQRYRAGRITQAQMTALIRSTVTGSWAEPRVQELCDDIGGNICAPSGGSGADAVIEYTSDLGGVSIPSGVVEMDFALNLSDGACPGCFAGRIDSNSALQYGGNPAVDLRFEGDPIACVDDSGPCRAFIDSLDAEVLVGSRLPTADDCPAGTVADDDPWLVPGFAAPQNGRARNCVAEDVPLGLGNPFPDGRARRRVLTLVDGMMIDQRVMALVLREEIDAFHGGATGLTAYIYVRLERQSDVLTAADTQGNAAQPGTQPDALAQPICTAEWLDHVGGADAVEDLTVDAANTLASYVVTGLPPGVDADPVPPEEVQTLCIWDEQIPDANGQILDQGDARGEIRRSVAGAGADGNQPCFPGAQIIYIQGLDTNLERHACNLRALAQTGENCLETLAVLILQAEQDDAVIDLSANAKALLTLDGVPAGASESSAARYILGYACDGARATCDDNRFDLREGKRFYRTDGVAVAPPLRSQIVEAFRYKERFANRTANIGFAPALCGRGAPYCYAPSDIEAVRARIDCVSALYHRRADLSAAARDSLRAELTANYAALDAGADGNAITRYGFERLYAELLILLGDEAFTASFASRFDLLGAAQLGFEGTEFENADGINVSGTAGFELYRLHQAAQTYRMVLERFYRVSPWLWETLAEEEGYLTAMSVTTWLDRVVQAAAQLARTEQEIAQRYQALNQGALALRVIERAYTRAYQEALILSSFLGQMIGTIAEETVPQVQAALQTTQRRFRVALLDMQQRHRAVRGRTDVFGLPPEFIPFPALDEDAVNGFEVMLDITQSKLDAAADDEEAAIDSRREFDTDAELFQSELVGLTNGYSERLGELCGTFIGDDGRTYPAIARFASRGEGVKDLLDPCGAAGNGALWLAGADLQTHEVNLRRVRQEATNALQAIEDTQTQLVGRCNLIAADVLTFLANSGAVQGLERDIDTMRTSIDLLDRSHELVTGIGDRYADAAGAESTAESVATQFSLYAFAISGIANIIATGVLQANIDAAEASIRALEANYEQYQINRECDYLTVEAGYTIRAQHRELLLTRLDILNAVWNVEVGVSDIQALANERLRLVQEWDEAEQLAVDAASASNDPNIRIFKNDAIRSADRTFARAVQAAWSLTRIFEYYTGSTYPEREQLFLARMVRHGDVNLRRYVTDLEDAFFGFEEVYGNPDTRVHQISMRDDVFNIPYYGDDGRTLTYTDRVEQLRNKLNDPAMLDESGAISIPFSTDFGPLSPRTVNHKILFIEVEMFGSDLGDDVGRIYLRQRGTGAVQGTDDRRRFFTFPPRTAVMNPIFEGFRDRGQDADGAITGPTRTIYRSYRFRERPLVQTNWLLGLDQQNEIENQDINLNGVDDIVLNVYYTDFTQD